MCKKRSRKGIVYEEVKKSKGVKRDGEEKSNEEGGRERDGVQKND